MESNEQDTYMRHSFFGVFWKFARIGERLSPYVSLCCIAMAVSIPIPLEATKEEPLM